MTAVTESVDDIIQCEQQIVLSFSIQDYAHIPPLVRTLKKLTHEQSHYDLSSEQIDQRLRDLREEAVLKVLAEARDLAKAGRYDPLGKEPRYLPVYKRALEIAEKDISGTESNSWKYRWLVPLQKTLERECAEAQPKK